VLCDDAADVVVVKTGYGHFFHHTDFNRASPIPCFCQTEALNGAHRT
jgi:hypothetical protein